MTDAKTPLQRFTDYQPSKPVWFWSCAGAIVLTIVVGFVWGGWTTAGSAQEMADTAAKEATNSLVASICVENYSNSPDFADHLASLKDASSWERSDMIEAGGWVTLAGMQEPYDNAARLCARQLVEMQVPEPDAEETAATTSG